MNAIKLSVQTHVGGGLYLSTGAYLGHESLYPGLQNVVVNAIRLGMTDTQVRFLASAWQEAWTKGADQGRWEQD